MFDRPGLKAKLASYVAFCSVPIVLVQLLLLSIEAFQGSILLKNFADVLLSEVFILK